MGTIHIPEGYKSPQSIKETEIAIKEVKDYFERALADALNLPRVSAPLFVKPESGLNDNLNGVERPVSFGIKEQDDAEVEIVHSLAKWKRLALKEYGFEKGEGLYTDMTAIRRDEETDNIHSIYVDQWDWEKIIDKSERNLETLKETVFRIYMAIKQTEYYMCGKYHFMDPFLPNEITFITTQELEDMYPDMTGSEREKAYVKEHPTACIMQIGGKLRSGRPHDGRAPDYDDWSLNCDIFFWNETLGRALEISSMGIRVDEEAMERQLKLAGCENRRNLPFHKMLLAGELPLTIGGGIGQSRLCMLMLSCAHIGEVQSSIWDEQTVTACEEAGIPLL